MNTTYLYGRDHQFRNIVLHHLCLHYYIPKQRHISSSKLSSQMRTISILNSLCIAPSKQRQADPFLWNWNRHGWEWSAQLIRVKAKVKNVWPTFGFLYFMATTRTPNLTSSGKESLKLALTGMAQLVGHHLTKQKVIWVQFQVRAHAWVAGLVRSWGVRKRQPIDVSPPHWCFSPSLSPSLPFSLKIDR